MICPKCGNDISAQVKFCPVCGNLITDEIKAAAGIGAANEDPAANNASSYEEPAANNAYSYEEPAANTGSAYEEPKADDNVYSNYSRQTTDNGTRETYSQYREEKTENGTRQTYTTGTTQYSYYNTANPQSQVYAPIPEPKPGYGLSIASMVLGICGFFFDAFFFIPSILAIVFGFVGLSKAGKNGKGRGFAIAGLVCGFVALAFYILCLILAIGVAGTVVSVMGF